jgi:hypothetical protein
LFRRQVRGRADARLAALDQAWSGYLADAISDLPSG